MHLFFSVGEPSGDLHASKLIRELSDRVPGFRATGLGGPLMAEAGCQEQFRLTDLSVMGLTAVLPLLWKFLRLLWNVHGWLGADRPDAVVLVDFPGFNWWVARSARWRGIPVYYLMPPQLWAWAPWRVRKMRRLVNLALCGLPFEQEWFEAHGVRAELVGHPFFDEVAGRRLNESFLSSQRSIATESPVVAILPGSRRHEVELNFPIQLEVIERLHRRNPQARFLVASYRDSQREMCEALYRDSGLDLPIEFCVGKTSEILELSRACLMVSGSVSLELLARRKPAVVLYRLDRLHHLLGKWLVTCKYISLPNLVADRVLMPEFVMVDRDQAAIEAITDQLSGWLTDPALQATKVRELEELAGRVARPGATGRIADALLKELGHSCTTVRRAA